MSSAAVVFGTLRVEDAGGIAANRADLDQAAPLGLHYLLRAILSIYLEFLRYMKNLF